MNKHLVKAKDYIGKGEAFYRKAADEVIAAQAEDTTLGYREIGEAVGRSYEWCRQLVKWRTSVTDQGTPWAGEYDARRDRSIKQTLGKADSQEVKRVLAELPEKQLDTIAREATDALVGRARAKRSERQSEPTAGELMGGEKWDPSESWADNQIIALNHKARSLAAHVEKWGPVLGSMPEDMAFEYLQEAERLIAEVRVVWQSRLREGAAA